MTRPLRVLIVEDSEDDAQLLVRELRRGGYDPLPTRIETADAMRRALAAHSIDVVISDNAMPQFSALGALQVLKDSGLDLPFIILSGEIGEQVAVAAMKAGAHDYLMKGKMARLVPAVERELQEAQVRAARRRADEALRAAKEELELRVAERTADLLKANENLVLDALAAHRAAERERELREQLARSRDSLSALLDSIVDEVWFCDAEGTIRPANRAARLSGIRATADDESDASLDASRLEQLDMRNNDGKPRSTEDAPLLRALRGETISSQIEVLRAPSSGHAQWRQVSAAPIPADSAVVGAVAVVRDITEQVRVEQFRQDYISLISHDLRNPLTSVLGWSDWLLPRLHERGMIREAKAVEGMRANARRMNGIVQDLLDTASLESGQIEMDTRPTDVSALLHEIVGRFGAEEERARVRIDTDGHLNCLVDRDKVERVVVNLLSNALKYSPLPSTVTICSGEQGGEALITVADRGPGISADDIRHIFDRFYRVASTSASEGLGLGLYIARLIVVAHGGRIWVDSEPGHGARFKFTVPLA